MKVSNFEKNWIDLVKAGRLDEAYKEYSRTIVHRILRFGSVPLLGKFISKAIIIRGRDNKFKIDFSDTAVDLSDEFLIFWKNPNIIGRNLSLKISKYYLLNGKIPARACAWLAHWLVFQGHYEESIRLFRMLIKSNNNTRLKGEIFALIGNYFYSRNKLNFSKYFHQQSTERLKASGDKFFLMFNIGSAAKTYAELENIESYESNILREYDGLNPDSPDERYGLRALIISSYIYYKHGQTAKADEFLKSANKISLNSGSNLDKAIYHIYSSAICFYKRELTDARNHLDKAKSDLKNFGRFKKFENLILEIDAFLNGNSESPTLIASLLLISDRGNIHVWHQTFYDVALPLLEKFNDMDLNDFMSQVQAVTDSNIYFEKTDQSPGISSVENMSFQLIKGNIGTSFIVDFFYGESKYRLSCNTTYQF